MKGVLITLGLAVLLAFLFFAAVELDRRWFYWRARRHERARRGYIEW